MIMYKKIIKLCDDMGKVCREDVQTKKVITWSSERVADFWLPFKQPQIKTR